MNSDVNTKKIGLVLISGPPGIGKSTFTNELSSYVNQVENQNRISKELNAKSLFVRVFMISYDHVIDKNLENQLVNNKKYANNTNENSLVCDWKSARNLINSLVKLFMKYLSSSRLDEEISMDSLNEFVCSNLDECMREHAIKENFLNCIERSMQKNAHPDVVRDVFYIILLDDLFYYESMRYAYYKLAVELESSYFAFCFKASELSFLFNRNKSREVSKQLDEAIIENVCAKFEYPKDWEVNFNRIIEVDRGLDFNNEYLNSCICLILDKLNEFRSHLDRLKLEMKLKAENELNNSKLNLVHECDLVLRKLIGAKLSGLGLNKSEKVSLASELNKKKLNILNSLKLDNSENASLAKFFNENRFDLIESELESKLFSDLN